MKNTDYMVTIREASKELSVKERIMLKDTVDALKLDDITKTEAVEITVDQWAVLDIHNEHTKGENSNKDYSVLLIIDDAGTKYTTGSQSFMTSFFDIQAELKEADALDQFRIRCYRMPSRNYRDKEFLTCSII